MNEIRDEAVVASQSDAANFVVNLLRDDQGKLRFFWPLVSDAHESNQINIYQVVSCTAWMRATEYQVH